jgi:hypothetical protein
MRYPRYPSHLTDQEWECIKRPIPVENPGDGGVKVLQWFVQCLLDYLDTTFNTRSYKEDRSNMTPHPAKVFALMFCCGYIHSILFEFIQKQYLVDYSIIVGLGLRAVTALVFFWLVVILVKKRWPNLIYKRE